MEGGDWPFLIDAGSAQVTMENLRFANPKPRRKHVNGLACT
jgi:hypothetical protein